jgi:hypothetical protein
VERVGADLEEQEVLQEVDQEEREQLILEVEVDQVEVVMDQLLVQDQVEQVDRESLL